MVMLRLLVVLAFPDTALTVNVALPEAVGVPEITPDELSRKPFGSDPELTDHVAFERLAARVALYELPTVPAGRESVVIVIVVGAGAVSLTTRVNSFVAGAPEAGLAFTVKVYVSAFVGVPEIVPVVLSSVRPVGRVVLLVSDQTTELEESDARVTE